MKKRLPKSLRKYIRKEKGRVRREVLDLEKQKELINELYKKFLKNKTQEKNENVAARDARQSERANTAP